MRVKRISKSVETTKKVLKQIILFITLLILLTSFSVVAFAQQSSRCPIAVYAGEMVRLSPEAYDPDPEIGPAGALIWSFGPPFDDYARWQTKKGQQGIFNFWVTVSDGELTDTKKSCVEVLSNNRNPIIYPVPDMAIVRGDSTQIPVTCYDPDGDAVTISYRFNGKDVAYIAYEPPGTYNLEVTCSDGFGGVDTEHSKLHILMPEVDEPERPKHVWMPPEEVEISAHPAGDVEVVFPDTGDVEVVFPSTGDVDLVYSTVCEPCPPCPPCPPYPDDELDLGEVDVIYEINQITEIKNAEKLAEQEKLSVNHETGCQSGLDRRTEISQAMGCC